MGRPCLAGPSCQWPRVSSRVSKTNWGGVAAGERRGRLPARETLDPPDHVPRVGGGLEEDAGCLPDRLVRPTVEDHLGAGRDDGQEIVQLVGHPCRKLPERAELLGPDQILLHSVAQGDMGTQLFVHPALLHGDCHMRRQHLEAVLFLQLVVVRGGGAEREDAQDPFRGANWKTENAGEAQRRILGASAVAGIRSTVPGEDGLPRAKCDARQAVGDGHEVLELHAGEAQAGHDPELSCGLIEQGNRDVGAPAELRRDPDQTVEDVLQALPRGDHLQRRMERL